MFVSVIGNTGWLTAGGPDVPGLPVLLMLTVVMAVGSAVQIATGFGMALVVVPLLAMLDPVFVPGPMLAAGVLCSLGAAWQGRTAILWPDLRTILVGMTVGTVLGVITLKAAKAFDLSKVFGGLILLAVMMSVSGLVVQVTKRSLGLGGAVGGFMGSIVGIHGPPLALVLQHEEPDRVRATLGAYLTVGYIWAIVVMIGFGLFGRADVMRTAVLLPGTLLGFALAPPLMAHIDKPRLRRLILTISAISGVALILRAS